MDQIKLDKATQKGEGKDFKEKRVFCEKKVPFFCFSRGKGIGGEEERGECYNMSEIKNCLYEFMSS